MHLVEAYSSTSRLRIDRMRLTEHFYPLGFDNKFVVIVTSSGGAGKDYAHYKIVVDKIKPALAAKGYKIVQVGGPKDERIGADLDLCGKTNTYQYFGVISRSELVLSGDTSALHVAGHYNKKIVSLFSISHPDISGAYFGDKANQIYLTPENWSPSFNPQENPKTIDSIKPERVVKAVSQLLELNVTDFETINVGADYRIHVLESIPNVIVRPDFFPEQPLNIRLDKGGSEAAALAQIRAHKSVLITDKPVDINALSTLRENIEGVIYIVTENDSPAFVEGLHRNGFGYRLVSFLPEDVLNPKKINYIDFNLLQRRDRKALKDLKDQHKLKDTTRFTTNKRILSGGKFYLSYGHLERNKPLDKFHQNEDTIIDVPSFWEDLEFYHIFNNHVN